MTIQATLAVSVWTIGFVTAVTMRRTPATFAAGFVFGWLFLPHFTLAFPGLPDWNKPILVSAVSFAAMFAVPRRSDSQSQMFWMDLAAFGVTCFSIPASISNGLGLYEGLSCAYGSFWIWTAPYLIGRRVFGTPTNALVLLRMIILGGLVYAAFCLYESKMSPRLHWVIYGMRPREGQNYFSQAMRYGLWRPMVFMEHGLALAVQMSIFSTMAWWAHATSVIPHIAGLRMRTVAWILIITTLLCVSTGAIALLALGVGILSLGYSKMARTTLLLAALIPVAYPVTRMMGSGILVDTVVSAAVVVGTASSDSRTDSFRFRVINEEKLLKIWYSNPLFGNGRFYRDTDDKYGVVTDSFWIIILGKYGFCAWICWTLMFVLPGIVTALRNDLWQSEVPSVVIVLSLSATIFAMDGLLNGVPNPILPLLAGTSVGLLLQPGSAAHNTAHAQPDKRTPPRVVRRLWPFIEATHA